MGPRWTDIGPRVSYLDRQAFEEGVAEYPVRLRRPVQVTDAFIEGSRFGKTGAYCRFSNAFDHRREGVASEAFNQLRTFMIGIDQAWRDVDRGIARFAQQWVNGAMCRAFA